MIRESEYESKPNPKQILDAEHLMTLQIKSLENDAKSLNSSPIIFDSYGPRKEDSKHQYLERDTLMEIANETTNNSEEKAKRSSVQSDPVCHISVPKPLPPLYQPGQSVPRVWSRDHATERLYRYRHIEGIVYPPGYLP